jgi:UDP-N-acetylmuramyl pentapeptide phosphotransferase/UDP-N-acetylglucosamine-1-phosphate transferase
MIFLNLLSLLSGFIIAIIAIPSVLHVARRKKLFDLKDERKIHTAAIPPFGGIAIFLGFILSTIIASGDEAFMTIKYVVAAVIILFFTGLTDDLVKISVRNKFAVQILAALLLIVLGNVRLSNGHGLFNIFEINYFFSVALTLFVMLSVINAFNFIDGIDGLAAGLGIVASLFFGIWFSLAGFNIYAVMSFALAGSLGGFFIYNVFGGRNKLFMGDTGSLITGLIISVLAIQFNEFNIDKSPWWSVNAAPAVSFAVVLIPLTDTCRVISIRLADKVSPFYPDNNHIHHRLLALIPDHFSVTLILTSAGMIMILLSVLFDYLFINVTMQFLMVFIIGMALSFVPSYILRKYRKSLRIKKYKSFKTLAVSDTSAQKIRNRPFRSVTKPDKVSLPDNEITS